MRTLTHDTSTSPENLDPFALNAEGQWDFYHLNEAYFDNAVQMVELAGCRWELWDLENR